MGREAGGEIKQENLYFLSAPHVCICRHVSRTQQISVSVCKRERVSSRFHHSHSDVRPNRPESLLMTHTCSDTNQKAAKTQKTYCKCV